MKRQFRKRPGCLVPMFQEDEEWLVKIKTDSIIEVEVKRPRNQKLHRKWWSLCAYLAEHSDRFPTSEHASKYMLIKLGYFVWIDSGKGGVPGVPIADSISFANMDDDEFNGMYSKACDLLCEIISHVTDENVKEVLESYAGVATEMRG